LQAAHTQILPMGCPEIQHLLQDSLGQGSQTAAAVFSGMSYLPA
jgi:hypothetical protein